MSFSIEEITLMKMYSGLKPNRTSILTRLREIQPTFNLDEHEIKDLVDGVVRKLTAMNDSKFDAINLSLALDEQGEEN